jgi:hypothetical protein
MSGYCERWQLAEGFVRPGTVAGLRQRPSIGKINCFPLGELVSLTAGQRKLIELMALKARNRRQDDDGVKWAASNDGL